jgi:hypothetical protein
MLSSDLYADVAAGDVVTKLKEKVPKKEVTTPKAFRMTVFTKKEIIKFM